MVGYKGSSGLFKIIFFFLYIWEGNRFNKKQHAASAKRIRLTDIERKWQSKWEKMGNLSLRLERHTTHAFGIDTPPYPSSELHIVNCDNCRRRPYRKSRTNEPSIHGKLLIIS